MIKNNEYAKRLESITRKRAKVPRTIKDDVLGFKMGQKERNGSQTVVTPYFVTQLRMWLDEHVCENYGSRRLRDTVPIDTDLNDLPDIVLHKGITITFRDPWMNGHHSQILRSTGMWRKRGTRHDYCLLNSDDLMIVKVKALFTVSKCLTSGSFPTYQVSSSTS